MTWELGDPLGWERCPGCGKTVMFAWDRDMEAVALEADDDGQFAVSLDGNRLPWCRPTAGTQLAFDESLYRPHDPSCPGVAPVIALPVPRPATPVTPRRAAR